MIKRNILKKLLKGLKFSPIILLIGPRQSGKTTLMREMANQFRLDYISFDNLSMLSGAKSDPMGFVDSLKKPIILDEVQRVPEIFLPLKADVDHNRIPGRYILTGSANPFVVPSLGDALTGRLIIFHLWPFSQGELIEKEESYIQQIFSEDFGKIISSFPCSKLDIINRLILGGFPSLHQIQGEEERRFWCDSYLSSSLQKDILDLSKIEGLAHLPNLLYIIASRLGSTLNVTDIARTISTPVTSVRRYLQLLHSLFLLYTLPSWNRNLNKRITKSPKVYFSDTALALHVLRFNRQQLEEHPVLLGGLVENFVIMEIVKQVSWNEEPIGLYHFRTDSGQEVDIVLEKASGEILGIEVKFTQTIQSNDFDGLRILKEASKGKFKKGIVLYAGESLLPFGEGMYAVPISMLWA